MGLYRFQEMLMEVQPDELENLVGLAPLWFSLSWCEVPAGNHTGPVCVSIHLNDCSGQVIPGGARLVFSGDGFSLFELGDEFFLSAGSSTFALQPAHGRGTAYLAPDFAENSVLLQRKFWSYGLLKLLRRRGYFSLHAAGLVTPEGRGVLLTGPPGSGKTTLVLGLVQNGWKYLSDDALLLRAEPTGVTAFGLRRDIYVDAGMAPRYSALLLGEEIPDSLGRMRRPVNPDENPFQRVSQCRPDLLLFTRIIPEETSILTPVNPVNAMKRLLDASGPQLLDRPTVDSQLDALRKLLKQTESYELGAGRDLYRNPETLTQRIIA
jgi:hypothetical protein